jgi:signal transduction histidine kinase
MIAPDSASAADTMTRASGEFLTADRLTKVSREFTYARSIAEILDLAVSQAAEMLGAEKAILLLSDEEGMLHVTASHGVSIELVQRFSESLDESLIIRLRSVLGTRLAEGFVGVPLVSNGVVIGLLAVLRPDGGMPRPDEEWILSALADQIAAPLENARLAAELERNALLSENGRLYESERAARRDAESAREEAEAARRQAESAMRDAEAARDLALESDKSKAAFLAAMSHDLRTPLNAIGGYVQLLKMGIRGPVTEEQAEDLDRIGRNQKHLLSIVSEILDFAKVGSGTMSYQQQQVLIASAIRDAEAMVMPQMKARQIEYVYEPGPEPVICLTDAEKLQQILLNLLSNAIKFTEPGGIIKVSFRGRDDQRFESRPVVEIVVHDTGSGIPSDKLSAVFLPFVQIERSLNNPGEGIGLGLAISRNLARGLGGDITVTSEYGKGSTFTLTLPLRN